MTRTRIIWGLGLLAAVVTTAARADEAEDVRKAVVGLVKQLEGKKDIAKAAEQAAKDHEFYMVMAAFKPAKRGGIGVGEKGDSIEIKISRLERSGVRAAELASSKDLQKQLLKVGRVSQAIAEMTQHAASEYARSGEKQKLWQRYSQDMKKAAAALTAAAKAKDAAKVKKAALDLNTSCLECHSDFRDN